MSKIQCTSLYQISTSNFRKGVKRSVESHDEIIVEFKNEIKRFSFSHDTPL